MGNCRRYRAPHQDFGSCREIGAKTHWGSIRSHFCARPAPRPADAKVTVAECTRTCTVLQGSTVARYRAQPEAQDCVYTLRIPTSRCRQSLVALVVLAPAATAFPLDIPPAGEADGWNMQGFVGGDLPALRADEASTAAPPSLPPPITSAVPRTQPVCHRGARRPYFLLKPSGAGRRPSLKSIQRTAYAVTVGATASTYPGTKYRNG
eukprot:COSAG01_NODE_2110_length_8408_cov_19.542183_2_plen_207_part_00